MKGKQLIFNAVIVSCTIIFILFFGSMAIGDETSASTKTTEEKRDNLAVSNSKSYECDTYSEEASLFQQKGLDANNNGRYCDAKENLQKSLEIRVWGLANCNIREDKSLKIEIKDATLKLRDISAKKCRCSTFLDEFNLFTNKGSDAIKDERWCDAKENDQKSVEVLEWGLTNCNISEKDKSGIIKLRDGILGGSDFIAKKCR